ncbi:MAG: hypothetical protein WDW36_002998 [Sanguina aurantia]
MAWDTVARFGNLPLPDSFLSDFARVADDESRHLGWVLQRMAELGCSYGDMEAHDLLWRGAQVSVGDVSARLAIVPLAQEARGLDAGSKLCQRLVGFGDSRSADIVARIALEERAHVAIGVEWFHHVCDEMGVAAQPTFVHHLATLCPGLMTGTFNHRERQLVGLPREWYDPTPNSVGKVVGHTTTSGGRRASAKLSLGSSLDDSSGAALTSSPVTQPASDSHASHASLLPPYQPSASASPVLQAAASLPSSPVTQPLAITPARHASVVPPPVNSSASHGTTTTSGNQCDAEDAEQRQLLLLQLQCQLAAAVLIG